MAFAGRCALRVYPLVGDSEFFLKWGQNASYYADSIIVACLQATGSPMFAAFDATSAGKAAFADSTSSGVSAAVAFAAYSAAEEAASASSSVYFSVVRASSSTAVHAASAASFADMALASYASAPEMQVVNLIWDDYHLLEKGAFSVENDRIDRAFFQRPLFDGSKVSYEQIVTPEIQKAFESIGASENLQIWKQFFHGKPPGEAEIQDKIERWYQEYQRREIEMTTKSSSERKSKAAPKKLGPKKPRVQPAYETEIAAEESAEETDKAELEPIVESESADILTAATASAEKPALVDSLNRQSLVESLANMLSMKQQGTPLTLGLFGHWGAGKSSVMSLLQKELSTERNKYPGYEFLFSWFNAWEYEHTKDIRAGLAQEVVNGLLSNGEYKEDSSTLTHQISKQDKRKLQWRHLREEHKEEYANWRVRFLLTFLTLIIGLFTLQYSDILGTGILGLFAYYAIEVFKERKQLLDHPLATELATFFKLPSYRKELGQVPVIRKQLKGLCNI